MDCLQLLLSYPSRTEEPLMRVKAGLKCNIKKLRSWHLAGPITSWQIKGGKVEPGQILFSWAPELLCTVIIVKNLKDTCSLEGKL